MASRARAIARRRYLVWRAAGIHRQRVAAIALPKGPGLDEATRAAALDFIGGLVPGYRDLRWHELYSRTTGQPSPFYLPEDIFHALVLPAMNPPDRVQILRDKNQFDLVAGWPALPQTLGRVMNGQLLDAGYARTSAEEIQDRARRLATVVVKPTRATGSGKNVHFVPPELLPKALSGLNDAIVQAPVRQHADLARLNPSSVNTLRATTYRRLDGEIVFLSSAVRIGRAASRVDNSYAGGLICGVDASGALAPVAYENVTRRHERHPDSGLVFSGLRFPALAAAREALLDAHARTPWIDFATWDLSIDETGQPILIEVNVGTTLSGPQTTSGPVFGQVADDMRERIGTRRRSALLGFI